MCNSNNRLYADFQMYKLVCFKFYFDALFYVVGYYFGAIVAGGNKKSLFHKGGYLRAHSRKRFVV